MFRNTDTKKPLNTSKIVPNPHDSLCDTDSTNFEVTVLFQLRIFDIWHSRVITILTVTISFTIPKLLCEHYIMGPFFLILQSLLIPYLQPHQLPVSK